MPLWQARFRVKIGGFFKLPVRQPGPGPVGGRFPLTKPDFPHMYYPNFFGRPCFLSIFPPMIFLRVSSHISIMRMRLTA